MKLLLLLTLLALPLAASVPVSETLNYPDGWAVSGSPETYAELDIAAPCDEVYQAVRFDVDAGYLPVLVVASDAVAPASLLPIVTGSGERRHSPYYASNSSNGKSPLFTRRCVDPSSEGD
jgi:hypothetical protein